MSISRFSSRLERLETEYLAKRLNGAKTYKRIAGYFRSSILELVGEELGNIPDVRIVCNSELDARDLAVAKTAQRDAAITGKWNEWLDLSRDADTTYSKDQYRKLYQLLIKGNVQIRVVPKEHVFVHGKAGVITSANDIKVCFMGSVNESRSAWARNYEILWEDSSSEGVEWVEAEFEALWAMAQPLPDALIAEIGRLADRVEVPIAGLVPSELPGASLAESPIYRSGEQLTPWQRSFVTRFLRHRDTYGKARLLLADEVGLGKTLSLATSALIAALLNDGKVLILCPATLTQQWQVELKDRLGVPSSVWLSNRKVWQDIRGHQTKFQRANGIGACPTTIAIVSTGLVTQQSLESEVLASLHFGMVILDEGHKARASLKPGQTRRLPNHLLEFMLRIARRTRHLLIGTATPIQTEVEQLWDLLRILNVEAEFVLGDAYSPWNHCEAMLPYVTGATAPSSAAEAWELIRSPLPPGTEKDTKIEDLRDQLKCEKQEFHIAIPLLELSYLAQELVRDMRTASFFQHNNPILRHTVLRRREVLERQGLLTQIGVDVHPAPSATPAQYLGLSLIGQALRTNPAFRLAYEAAEDFTAALAARTKMAGFLKSLILQRICSSFEAGRLTAQRLLARAELDPNDEAEDTEAAEAAAPVLESLTIEEGAFLQTIVDELSRPGVKDPKLEAVQYFLSSYRTDGKPWLEHGCIVFSQYYDTVAWVAERLSHLYPLERIGVYAGAGKSKIFENGFPHAVDREFIKAEVKRRTIRLVIATDAACEGLNLQTLGTLINIDLPWNPSRLEQRLGRIKRIGQQRSSVDMLNLVYHDTRDEKVYAVLSTRLRNRYDIFGGLPDTIDDDWIESEGRLAIELDKYIERRAAAKNAFELRYHDEESANRDSDGWELCSKVLSRGDVIKQLSKGWA